MKKNLKIEMLNFVGKKNVGCKVGLYPLHFLFAFTIHLKIDRYKR